MVAWSVPVLAERDTLRMKAVRWSPVLAQRGTREYEANGCYPVARSYISGSGSNKFCSALFVRPAGMSEPRTTGEQVNEPASSTGGPGNGDGSGCGGGVGVGAGSGNGGPGNGDGSGGNGGSGVGVGPGNDGPGESMVSSPCRPASAGE